MTIATTNRPLRYSEMGRQEAEKITEDIRSNFDSLGKMLVEVRDRKGYRALGYTSLESYCLTEFGKGRSRVYQLIEEAEIEEGIITELAASDSAIKTLKMPGSYLRQLKALESPQQQIEAIGLANKLAENEGKPKATKLHLQVAINKLSPKPEQTKQSLKALGFDKGTEVEVIKGSAKGQRGVIRKIDKGIHVELYSGNSKPILYDISDLKCVPQAKRPLHPACIDTVSIGDKIHVFSANKNNGKNGQIIARVNDKLALVEIEGDKVEIPYAEIEKITVTEEDFQRPSNDSIWAGKWNHLSSWYYNVKEHKIHSFGCPDLILQPPKKCADPAEWLEEWRQKNLKSLIEAFFTQDDLVKLINMTPAKAKELVMAQAIELPQEKAKEFASDLIAGLRTLFWDELPGSPTTLIAENEQLREQLIEAEATIKAMIKASISQNSSPGEATPHTDFSLENMPEILSPGEATPHADFSLENTPEILSPEEITRTQREEIQSKSQKLNEELLKTQ